MKAFLYMILSALLCSNVQAAEIANYPKYVTKELYADHDLRGKKAPKLVVEQWLNGSAPKTTGKVVLIDFWATWCPPCVELIPELNEYKKKFGDDLIVIAISNEPEMTVRKFMKIVPMNYDVAIDTTRNMKDQVGVDGIPHVLVISPDGIVRWQGFPGVTEDELNEDKIAQIIEASKAQTQAQTGSTAAMELPKPAEVHSSP